MNPPRALTFKSRLLSRVASAWIILGVGMLAGPLLPFAAAASEARQRQEGGRPIPAEPAFPPKNPSAQGGDLSLNKEGERKAEALAAFSQGLVAEEDGDGERAFAAYRRSLAADPDNTELAVKVGFELARRGEVAEGVNLLKDAAKGAPRDPLPPLCLAQIYAKFLKKPALAIKNAALALELDPDNVGAYVALVELHTENGQPQKASAILQRALKRESSDPDFWLQLAELCARIDLDTGKNGGAAAPSPGQLQRANSLYRKALACDPEDTECLTKAADFYFETRQFDAAAPLYRKLADTAEEPDSDENLALRDKLARSLMESGQREAALDVLQKMGEAAPQRVETHALIGDVHLLEGRLDQALAAYREVIRLAPSIAPAYLRVADLEMRLGQSAQAIATLRQCREKYPGTALVTYSLAVTLAQARRYAEALPVFEETLREAPASKPGLPDAGFYLAYGMAAEQAGEIERAARLLKKSIELAPGDSAQACNYLGYMWADRGIHLAEAGALIQRALALEPKNGAYLDSLGWYFYKKGDYPQAVTHLLKAVAALPAADPVVYEHLGDAYAASGQPAKAVETWQKALALDPENKMLSGKIASAGQK